MPASTLDPINAAIRASITKNNSENSLETQLASSTKKSLLNNIDFENAGSIIIACGKQVNVFQTPGVDHIVLKHREEVKTNTKMEVNTGEEETLKQPKYELFPMESIQLGWNDLPDWSAGCGMINMGNTCYLNSTLQALFHVPALANWLISDKEHYSSCYESGGFCIICSMRRTLLESQNSNMNAIRPIHIYNKLRLISRNFILNRQEDAHEFLRHLIEAMEKAYLNRFKNNEQFDARVKETTPLNQIFGGYLRSAVTCQDCGHVSTTFQHFQDLLLDIRRAQTVEEALDGYFSRERIDDDTYHCESCRKKVSATKQFSLERAPAVLCVQLKRFSVTNTKINRHIAFRQRLDLTKHTKNRPSTPLVYKLVSIITHIGSSVNCGHYTAIGSVPSGNFYQFDDSNARPISYQGVLSTFAYILMYELESPPYSRRNLLQKPRVKTTTSTEPCSSKSKPIANGIGFTSNKVYGPELPQNGLIKRNNEATSIPSNTEKEPESELKNGETQPQKTSHNTPDQVQAAATVGVGDQIVPIKSLETGCSTVNSETKTITKLVPYEEDDSSSSNESSAADKSNGEKIVSDAMNGIWKVSPTVENSYEPSKGTNWTESSGPQNDKVVNELFKMSYKGFSSVSTWNGTRSRLDKEVANERREERKRTIEEVSDPIDQGRKKHVKTHNNFKSNPGYHPIEEYHSSKNWNHRNNNSNSRFYGNKQFYNKNGHRHRYNFHHKNYHNKHARM
ncbi:ubiquitin carboxyl-terminal hydrolase 36 [Coccinella septempunctata]|uniref:ubiquitin carboxyl-terminal hydrolase 36 n=1 Tax=Coccinella septempunctata TaxID=41139 RepID=UPI001D095C70|nr:ubiquitin carboxyl-terminal hydrolase 36 [Coccinella septempunctata]